MPRAALIGFAESPWAAHPGDTDCCQARVVLRANRATAEAVHHADTRDRPSGAVCHSAAGAAIEHWPDDTPE
jgi:hypothetical protein